MNPVIDQDIPRTTTEHESLQERLARYTRENRPEEWRKLMKGNGR